MVSYLDNTGTIKPDQKIQNKITEENLKSGIKDFGVSVLLALFGFLVALGLFLIYQNYKSNNEKNNLIPKAKKAYLDKEYSQAIKLFLDADQYFKDNLEVKKYLAELYFIKGHYNDSVKYYGQAYSLNPEFTEREISNYGNALLKIGDKDAVIKLWQNKNLKPQDHYALAEIYLEKNYIDQYKLELEKIKNYHEPLLRLQVFNTDLDITFNNLQVIENAEKISGEYYDFETFKFQITEAKKQLDAGKKDYAELIQLAAFSNIHQCRFLETRIINLKNNFLKRKIPIYQIEFLEGKCANQNNDPDTAINLINKAIDADKSNIEYREELANSYFLKKDIENLNKTYNEIILIQKNSKVLSNYAGYLYKLGKKGDALKIYNDAFVSADTPKQATRIAKTILQINFLDNKNLNVCYDEKILEALNENIIEEYFLKSHCLIYKKQEVRPFFDKSIKNIEIEYIYALSTKNKNTLEKLLDQDTEGIITTYYEAVGENLLRI